MHTWWIVGTNFSSWATSALHTSWKFSSQRSAGWKMAKEKQGECHLFTLNLKSHIKAMANFLKGKSSAKYQWPFLFWQSLFHTVKEWKSLAHFSLKCRFSLCEARAKLKWNLKVDSPAVTLAYSSKSPINFAKILLQFIERKSLYILPINLDMEVQFVHWPWLFPNPFSHLLHCVTQLKLETLYSVVCVSARHRWHPTKSPLFSILYI